jgi:hypothetical protein
VTPGQCRVVVRCGTPARSSEGNVKWVCGVPCGVRVYFIGVAGLGLSSMNGFSGMIVLLITEPSGFLIQILIRHPFGLR